MVRAKKQKNKGGLDAKQTVCVAPACSQHRVTLHPAPYMTTIVPTSPECP